MPCCWLSAEPPLLKPTTLDPSPTRMVSYSAKSLCRDVPDAKEALEFLQQDSARLGPFIWRYRRR
eukprot:1830704-Pyramimonas_sp.AAC.1